MRKLAFLLIFLLSGPVFADDCVSVNRSGWPAKYQTRSVAGAVAMLAGDQGVDPAINPGPQPSNGRVYQDGLDKVCVKDRNPAFNIAAVTSSALLQKLQDNDAINDDSATFQAAEAEKKSIQTSAADAAKNFDNLNTKQKDALLKSLLRLEELRQEGKS